MKFENLILHSLYAACFAICLLTVGAMIVDKPSPATTSVASQANVAAHAAIHG
ncbi:hypothetical protein [Dyella solisilvae]|uniref:hypothetical protein n=1 Tax=Dyella solisilvae TaxID=1920168 RepID=UPI0013143F61|nr:hypothetical protein [Dyella solisilvae]